MESKVKFTDVVFIHRSGMLLLHQRYNHTNFSLDEECNTAKAHVFSGTFLAFLKILKSMCEMGFPIPESSKRIQLRIGVDTCCNVLIDDLYIIVAFTQYNLVSEPIDHQVIQMLELIKREFDDQYRGTLEQWDNDLNRFKEFKDTINAILDKNTH